MVNKEFPGKILKSAELLGEIQASIAPINQEYQDAGLAYAAHCIGILTRPDVASAFIKYSPRLACYDNNSHGLTYQAYIELVNPEDGKIKLEYVVSRSRVYAWIGDEEETDDEQYADFLKVLPLHHPKIDQNLWAVSGMVGNPVKEYIARRPCLPEDIIGEHFLPSFVGRVIETCERIKEVQQGELVVLTESFRRAAQILRAALTP